MSEVSEAASLSEDDLAARLFQNNCIYSFIISVTQPLFQLCKVPGAISVNAAASTTVFEAPHGKMQRIKKNFEPIIYSNDTSLVISVRL